MELSSVTPGLLPFVILTLMESRAFPQISSFVIRFVVESFPADGEEKSNYRGAIRHIQSEEQLTFNTWDDAVTFIRHYVPLDTEAGQVDP